MATIKLDTDSLGGYAAAACQSCHAKYVWRQVKPYFLDVLPPFPFPTRYFIQDRYSARISGRMHAALLDDKSGRIRQVGLSFIRAWSWANG